MRRNQNQQSLLNFLWSSSTCDHTVYLLENTEGSTVKLLQWSLPNSLVKKTMHVYICVYIYIYIYMCVCVCVCVCVCRLRFNTDCVFYLQSTELLSAGDGWHYWSYGVDIDELPYKRQVHFVSHWVCIVWSHKNVRIRVLRIECSAMHCSVCRHSGNLANNAAGKKIRGNTSKTER